MWPERRRGNEQTTDDISHCSLTFQAWRCRHEKEKRTRMCKKRKLNVLWSKPERLSLGSTFKLFLCPASIEQCDVTSCPNSSRNQCSVAKAVTMSGVCMYVRACTSSLYSTLATGDNLRCQRDRDSVPFILSVLEGQLFE